MDDTKAGQFLGIHPINPSSARSSPSTKTSITRTGLSSPIQSSRHSGSSVLCPRSVPSTNRFIRSPQFAQKSYRENQIKQGVFTQPRPKADIGEAFQYPYLNGYDALFLALGDRHEAARVHHASRWCGGMAAGGSSSTIGKVETNRQRNRRLTLKGERKSRPFRDELAKLG